MKSARNRSTGRFACLCACLIALPLATAACKGEKKAAQSANAEGEILPGSASDAMLPYDTVRSQPPLAPPPSASGKPGAKSGTAAADSSASDAAEEAADAAPPAAASPAPEG